MFIFFAAIVLLGGLAVYISIFGLTDHLHPAQAIVVFGTQVTQNGEPSRRLQARLDRAIQVYQDGLAPLIIVSGSIDSKSMDEAAVMKAYLLQHGIPEQAIYTDNQGNDTFSTARNTASLMRPNGWDSLLLVSQYYHLARCRLAFRRFGISSIYTAHADFFEPRDLYSLGREVIALLYYWVRSYP